MAQGYVRQSAGVIVTGNTIQASDFNNEYNALEGAFDATSGHNHDGTVGGGAPLPPSALSGLSGNGLVARTSSTTFAARTLTGPAAGITVSNGDGVSGNPTLALANDLAALEALASTGIAVRSASDTWVQRTITGTSNRLTVTDGNGVSGNPTLDISSSYAGQNTITTLGTITTGVWTGTTIALANGGTGATDASGARTNLGLGTAATQNTGTSGNTIPFLDGTNTWSGAQTINAAFVFNETGADVDARFEGDTEQNLLFLDASIDSIGFGTGTVAQKWHFASTDNTTFGGSASFANTGATIRVVNSSTTANSFCGLQLYNGSSSVGTNGIFAIRAGSDDSDMYYMVEGGKHFFYGVSTATPGAIVTGTVGPSDTQQHTLPAVTSDTFTLNDATQTLNNKTLVAPVLGVATATSVNFGQDALNYYDEGTWTPTASFVTAGDLSVVYSTRVGDYTRVGRMVTVTWRIVTSTFTHTTASGSLVLTGLPFTIGGSANSFYAGSMKWQGITKAGYTQITPECRVGETRVLFNASASGSAISAVVSTDVPSGGTLNWVGTLTYFV